MTAARRRSLKKSQFGLPEEDKYPLDTRGRAANAKARATQQYKKGNLSLAKKKKIDRRADEVLYGGDRDKKNRNDKKDPNKNKEDRYDEMYKMVHKSMKEHRNIKKEHKKMRDRRMKSHYDSVDEMRRDAKRKGRY